MADLEPADCSLTASGRPFQAEAGNVHTGPGCHTYSWPRFRICRPGQQMIGFNPSKQPQQNANGIANADPRRREAGSIASQHVACGKNILRYDRRHSLSQTSVDARRDKAVVQPGAEDLPMSRTGGRIPFGDGRDPSRGRLHQWLSHGPQLRPPPMFLRQISSADSKHCRFIRARGCYAQWGPPADTPAARETPQLLLGVCGDPTNKPPNRCSSGPPR